MIGLFKRLYFFFIFWGKWGFSPYDIKECWEDAGFRTDTKIQKELSEIIEKLKSNNEQ